MNYSNTNTINRGLQVRVTSNRHVWCGPAALSAALGITTKEALAHIKRVSLRRFVKGVTYSEMLHAVAEAGVRAAPEKFPRDAKDCPTLKAWLETRKKDCTYLVCITGHWITVRGNHWVCNMNVFGRLLTSCPYLRAKVRYTIQLQEG